MKSTKYILLISCFLLLNFHPVKMDACSSSPFHPYGYRMYRAWNIALAKSSGHQNRNLLLWQQQTSLNVPLEDIQEVVYDWTIEEIEALMNGKSLNRFARWIKSNGRTDIVEYLTLAKQCSKARDLQNDPWYYPDSHDETFIWLDDVISKAEAYTDGPLKDRYALQIVRAKFAMRDYAGCLEYWNNEVDKMPSGLMKEMIASYVAGAAFRSGKHQDAINFYFRQGDLGSVRFCYKKLNKAFDNISVMEEMQKWTPDSPEFAELLQEEISQLEYWGGADDLGYKERFSKGPGYEPDEAKANRLLALVEKELQDSRVEEKALWYYTGAFLEEYLGHPYVADNYLKKGEKAKGAPFIKDSIKAMRIYLDAKLSVYDVAYEQKLYRQLQWLDEQILKETTTVDQVKFLRENDWKIRYGISFCYWNDIMRRILIAEVCPRMIDVGKPVRSLQLMNYADNRLLQLIKKAVVPGDESYNEPGSYNPTDFNSYFFEYADQIPISILRSYIGRISDPKSNLESFLNQRSLVDRDYLYELLGTKYLRERDYRNSIYYLSMVSTAYQSRTNIKDYMDYNPFEIRKTIQSDNADYKYRFVQEMLRLEREISTTTDPDLKAAAMIRKGIGLRNSVTFCWPLTEYWYSYRHKPHDKSQTLYEAEKLFREGLATVKDRQLAAKLNLVLYRWKTAVQLDPDSQMAYDIQRQCDELIDYDVKWLLENFD